jgi:hypothetical protein
MLSWSRNYPPFMEPEGSQEPANRPYHEAAEPIQHPQALLP